MSDGMEWESLEPKRVPIWLGRKRFKDDSKTMENPPTHMLKQAPDAVHASYQSLAAKGTTMQDGKVTVGTHLGELNSFLVSQCLWECDEAGQPVKLVPLSAVKNMLGNIVKALADEAEEISGLKVKESPERKALIAAFSNYGHTLHVQDGDARLDSLRSWVQMLVDQDAKLYSPLWNLCKPSEEEIAKNSQ
jgi:hypothetical protein